MTRLSSLALATVLTLGSTVSAAHAGVTDIEHLGSGGLCNTSETTGGLVKIGENISIGQGTANKNCNKVLGLIDRLRNKEIDSEERINNKLINSQNTIGMINSIGSIAAPLLGGLFANSQARAQATPQASDNTQYLQVIQQQQQQIEELRQMMIQKQTPVAHQGYSQHLPIPTTFPSQTGFSNQAQGSTGLRQVNLF